MNRKNILITAPSLNPQENVSGISTVASLLLKENSECQYKPFVVGKKDNEKRTISWIFKLLVKPIRLFFFQIGHIDLVHFNTAFEPKALIRDSLLFCVLLLRFVPLVLHIHGGRYMNRSAGMYRPIIKFLLKRSDKIIVLSELEKSYLLSNYPDSRANKIWVVSNAISLPSICVTEKDFSSNLILLFLGRIDKSKGLQKIADALKVIKEKGIPFIFYLCGVGPDKEWLMSYLSDSLLQENVVDKGVVYGDEKSELLKRSTIYLLPSDFEGLPLSLLESMGYYVVPIVSPVGSIPDVVNKENGKIASTVDEIVEAVTELNSDREKLKSLACVSRKTIVDRYSSTRFVQLINEVYASL